MKRPNRFDKHDLVLDSIGNRVGVVTEVNNDMVNVQFHEFGGTIEKERFSLTRVNLKKELLELDEEGVDISLKLF